MSRGHTTSAVPRPRADARPARRSGRAGSAGSAGSAGTSDRSGRGRGRARQSWYDDAPQDADPADDSWNDGLRHHRDPTRLGTRPVADDHQLVTRRPHRWLLASAALAIVSAAVAALFVIPVQAWMRQEDEILDKQQELSVLTEANRKLSAEVVHLGTPEGAKEAARDELGVVAPGERRISVLPPDTAALPLPAGWPFETIAQIIAIRQSVPAPPTAP
jgi:cell division protein FtsB